MKARYALNTSVFALMICSVPAAAQSSPAANAEQAVEPAAGQSAEADVSDTDIVVRGYRAALGSAQERKRNSDAILDAIVAEDIGKLPDNNAAEAIARVAGVQVSRSGDDATGVLIRGLPDVATTANGREIFTAENRSVALRDFPAGALAGLEVYKSGTASIIEAGLAGLINVRSRKPFDFDGLEIAGAVRGTYNDQSGKYDVNGNLLISDRWQTGIGEFGALINFSLAQQQYQNAVRYDDGYIATPGENQAVEPASVGKAIRFPWSSGLYYSGGKRQRPSINGMVQWKPTPDLEIYADGLWQAYRGQAGDDQFNVNFSQGDPTLSNIVFVDGEPNKVASLTATGGTQPPTGKRSQTKDYTNTYQFGGGFNWFTGRAKISSDFAYIYSEYGATSSSLTAQMTAAPTVNVEFERKRGASFDITGVDATDPANYIIRDYYESRQKSTGSGIQWRGDIELETDLPFAKTLQVGFRYSDRKAGKKQGGREIWLYEPPAVIPLTSLPAGEIKPVPDGFRDDLQPFQNFPMPTRANLLNKAPDIRGFLVPYLKQLVALNPGNVGYERELDRFGQEQAPYDPNSAYGGNEQSYAAYGQIKYGFDLGFPIDGLIGARLVNTVGKHDGISRVTDALGVETVESFSIRQNYVDFLPNVSARLKFTSELQLRLGFTRTRTRPEFSTLNPTFNLSQTRPTEQGPVSRFAYTGSGGNPDLLPLTSKNYDASLEYYFSKNGSASVAVFYRDLFGFISNYTREVNDPTFGLIQVSRPENAGAGKLKGIEGSFQSFFDFLPGILSGFGVQANITYLDGKNALPSALGADAPFVKIPGISKWTYNLTGFYEKGPLSARLSYNRRSEYVNFYSRTEADEQFAGELTRAGSRLDLSISYTPIDAITFTIDATNLLAAPFENYRYYNPTQFYPRDVREEGRYFGAGARFRV